MWQSFTLEQKMAGRSFSKIVPVLSFWRCLASPGHPWTGKPEAQAIRPSRSAEMKQKNSLTLLNMLWKWLLGWLKSLWVYQQKQSLKKPHNRRGAKSDYWKQYPNYEPIAM